VGAGLPFCLLDGSGGAAVDVGLQAHSEIVEVGVNRVIGGSSCCLLEKAGHDTDGHGIDGGVAVVAGDIVRPGQRQRVLSDADGEPPGFYQRLRLGEVSLEGVHVPVVAVVLDGDLQFGAQHIDPEVLVRSLHVPVSDNGGGEEMRELELQGDLRAGASPTGPALRAACAQCDAGCDSCSP